MNPGAPQVTPADPLAPPPQNQGQWAANRTAPSSSNSLPAPARRPDRQIYNHPLPLHDPYGPDLSLPKFGDLVRQSLSVAPEPPVPPQNQEEGHAPTRNWPRSSHGKRWEFVLLLIHQIFSWFQMGLPSVYFHRVALVIQKSEISMADLASIQRRGASRGFLEMISFAGGVSLPTIYTPAMERFKLKWEAFATRCMEEWKILNIVSTLLLSILLTFLQIAEAGFHPVTRLTALLSLECAFMSLLYCVLYISHFQSFEDAGATNWVIAAIKTSTAPYWNMWLFLALPALWLAWSLIFFSTSLLSFVWTSGDRRVPELTPVTDEDGTMDFIPMSFRVFTPLWPRIILTAVFIFGLGMGVLVMKTFRGLDANKREPPK